MKLNSALKIWKPIPDYEGYYSASSMGDIRNDRTGRILKPTPSAGKGYLCVTLCREGKIKWFHVHVLITLTFRGKKSDPNLQAAHDNDDHLDNRAANLFWKTHQQNTEDRARNGGDRRGEQISNKLADSDVHRIKRLLRLNKHYGSGRRIAEEYGVHEAVISAIKHEKTWGHIQCG